jgi:hypothetical protein
MSTQKPHLKVSENSEPTQAVLPPDAATRPQAQLAPEPTDIVIEVPELSLEALEQMDDSVLAKALLRFTNERRAGAGSDGAAMHTNTTHTDTHSSSMW